MEVTQLRLGIQPPELVFGNRQARPQQASGNMGDIDHPVRITPTDADGLVERHSGVEDGEPRYLLSRHL
uniref:Uncharacterized protein n=1 Tax=Candidatus Kentrum sp. LPFa TaxID=2126335 RepID=A0A450W7M5_9GAMM|nr:MAG: hypothetical protein BECKLPF1236A_GA0070988_100815 [Candidatus Kentron sp. LPFa]VFK25931.1 MAG: hypothetical protein BECKLPF1236C_GA0070990_1002717 [Candidatus Kentron sp. LPFa]